MLTELRGLFKHFINYFIIKWLKFFYSPCVAHDKTEKILVIRLDEIGDMVLMSPFFRGLRRAFPCAEITAVVKPAVYNLIEMCPYIDNILIYQHPSGRWGWLKNYSRALEFARKELRPLQCDLAIVPRWDSDCYYGAGLLAYLSGAARRVGYSSSVNCQKAVLDYGYDCFFTELLYNNEFKHELKRNLDVLNYVTNTTETNDNCLEFWTSNRDRDVASLAVKPCRDNRVIRIAVFLSAGARAKEMSVNCYLDIVKELEKVYKLEIYLLGDNQNTAEYGSAFMEEYPTAVNFIGETSLRETGAILGKCDVYLGGDTGPMHIAAAVGCRGVAVFSADVAWQEDGLNTPERFGPWSKNFICLTPKKPLPGCENGCRKNYPHCITQISVDEIVDAMKEQIDSILQERIQ